MLHLFVEGEVTEATYADRINQHLGRQGRFHLRVSKAGGSPRDLVEAAIQMRAEELPRAGDRRDTRRDPEVWCLFDRDEHGHVDGAIADAERNGVRVAFSHPCFELWLLLHFQQFETALNGRCSEVQRKLHRRAGFRHFDKYIGQEEWSALQPDQSRSLYRCLEAARLAAVALLIDCRSGCLPYPRSTVALARNADFLAPRRLRDMAEITRSESEWREQLTPEQYRILREAGTEPPFSGKYVHVKDDGVYRCAACGAELFGSDTKFESGTGWPSFTEPVVAERVELLDDFSHGMHRTEVRCKRCGSHLGHVFPDGPAPTGQRYCINSLALDLDTTAADS